LPGVWAPEAGDFTASYILVASPEAYLLYYRGRQVGIFPSSLFPDGVGLSSENSDSSIAVVREKNWSGVASIKHFYYFEGVELESNTEPADRRSINYSVKGHYLFKYEVSYSIVGGFVTPSTRLTHIYYAKDPLNLVLVPEPTLSVASVGFTEVFRDLLLFSGNIYYRGQALPLSVPQRFETTFRPGFGYLLCNGLLFFDREPFKGLDYSYPYLIKILESPGSSGTENIEETCDLSVIPSNNSRLAAFFARKWFAEEIRTEVACSSGGTPSMAYCFMTAVNLYYEGRLLASFESDFSANVRSSIPQVGSIYGLISSQYAENRAFIVFLEGLTEVASYWVVYWVEILDNIGSGSNGTASNLGIKIIEEYRFQAEGARSDSSRWGFRLLRIRRYPRYSYCRRSYRRQGLYSYLRRTQRDAQV